MAESLEPCDLHDVSNCAICHPPAPGYRRGVVAHDAPAAHYIEIIPGTGVYHQPDCYMVSADWEGASGAKLGKRVVRSPDDIRRLALRPAQCCEPPLPR
jgi:hypothetical protein